MSPSTPISINVAASRAELSSTASSPSSAGLYVPVHKRTGSDTPSHASSSRPTSPVSVEQLQAPAPHQFIYTHEELLSLAPLAHISPEARASIRSAFPELVMNRKMRKSIEYRAAQQQRAPTPRRARPIGRAPERRRNALKVVDEAAGNWRSMRVPAVPIAM